MLTLELLLLGVQLTGSVSKLSSIFFKQRSGIYGTCKFSGHSILASRLNTKYCCNTWTWRSQGRYLKIHWINFRRLFCDTSHNYAIDTRTQHGDIKQCAKVTQEGGNICMPKPVHKPPECPAVTQHQLRCLLAHDGTSTLEPATE